jgi:exo-beta-1,3-glucanase (GH17 family)
MKQSITINTFKKAMNVVEALTDAGYEVLVSSDNHFHSYEDQDGIRKEKSYMIYYIHPQWDGDFFELNSEVEEQLRIIKAIEEAKDDEVSTTSLEDLKKELGIKK